MIQNCGGLKVHACRKRRAGAQRSPQSSGRLGAHHTLAVALTAMLAAAVPGAPVLRPQTGSPEPVVIKQLERAVPLVSELKGKGYPPQVARGSDYYQVVVSPFAEAQLPALVTLTQPPVQAEPPDRPERLAQLRPPRQAAQQAPSNLRILILDGEGAINNIRQRTAGDPVVQVVDGNDRPVVGAAVTFLLPTRGASGGFVNGAKNLTILTNSQGVATATGLAPNTVAGEFTIQVTASYQGQVASASIAQANSLTGGAAASGGGGGGISAAKIGIIAGIAAAAAVGVALIIRKPPPPPPPCQLDICP